MLGERLKLARQRAGLSLRGLAARLDGRVTAQAIGKYERNAMKPSAPVLEALARSLGHPPGYFTEQAPMALNGAVFRRQAGLGARERTRIEVAVLEQVERHLLLEELLALDRGAASMPVSQQQPGTGISSSGDELGEALADRLRSTWDLGGEPIMNLTRVLERHGIEILLLELPEGIAGVACQVRRFDRPAVPCIVVDPATDRARRRMALAGELAQLLLEPGSAFDSNAVVQRFAAALLLPAAHMRAEIGVHRRTLGASELDRLAGLYGVSAAMVLLRCEQLGILASPPPRVRVRQALQTDAHGWRRVEPAPVAEADVLREVPQRFVRLCDRAIAEGLLTPAGAAELLHLPPVGFEQAARKGEGR